MSSTNKFRRWLNGEEDILLNNLRMKPIYEDHIKKEPSEYDRMVETTLAVYEAYDEKTNAGLRRYNLLYRIAAILF